MEEEADGLPVHEELPGDVAGAAADEEGDAAGAPAPGVGVTKTFDKKGPHAGKFSVKYKDDPSWWTHSLLREGYGKDKHWILLGLPSRDSA